MPTRRSRRSPRVGLLAGLAAAIAWAPARAQLPDGPALLDVKINGQSINMIGDFVEKGGKLYATRKELRELGLNVAGDEKAEVALSDLPNVHFTVDEQAQTLEITIPVSQLAVTRLEANGLAANTPISKTGSGMVFTYQATGLVGKDSTGALLTGEARAFGEWGVASTNFTATGLPGADNFVRLDSTYTYSDPDSMRRYRLGDVISGGLPWTRPVRLAGAQLAVDFSMQPNLVTFPTPSVAGQAAVPSTVDVLVNGVQALSKGVPQGPFNVAGLPFVGGAGTISMNLRDPSGNLTTQLMNFYIAPTMMKQGLSSFSFETGAVRRNYGSVSDDYGEMAGSGTGRYGVTNALTVSGHVEAARELGLVEGGLTALVGDFGTITAASGVSEHHGRTGGVFYGAVQRETPHYSLAGSIQLTSPNFQDIAGLNDSPPSRRVVQASAGMSLGRYGSIGVVYARVDGPLFACTCTALDGGLVTAATGAAASSLTTDHASLVSGTYSARLFGRLSFSASAYEDIHNHSGGGLLSLTIPLGRRSSANPALQYANDDLQPALQMSRSDTRPGEWGGQLYDAEGGPMTRRFAEAEYRAPWGVIGAGVDSEAGSPVIGRVTLNGSITSLDGGTFLSPPIQDSFGVVDANGRAGVPVYVENQLVGKTDASGKLLLPDLRSYGVSKVAIDPSDLALDSEAAHSDLFVRPADRSGVVATFSIKTIDQALITLVDEKGSPIPVASTAVLPNNPERFPVGYDGQLYLTGLESHNRVKVTLPNGDQCVVEFEYKRAKGDIFRAGPLVCRPDAPTGLRGRAPSTPVAPPDRAETGPVGLRGRI